MTDEFHPQAFLFAVKTAVVKQALTVRQVGEAATAPVAGLSKLIGGPNVLTNTLAGAAVGGAGGALLGQILDRGVKPTLNRVFPDTFDEDVSHTRMLGLLGVGLGSLPGLAQGTVALTNGRSILSNFPWPGKKLASWEPQNPDTTGLTVPSIPVDAFNQVVWDTTAPGNPFGTRSVYGTGHDAMYVPPQAAAVTTGLLAATGAAKGQEAVSPLDVAATTGKLLVNLGMNAGVGMLAGLAVGHTLSSLAGLTPSKRDTLVRSGEWAGAITGIARTLGVL